MSSDLSSAPLFAAGIESKRRGEGLDESGSKLARLEEMRARLSPTRESDVVFSSSALPPSSSIPPSDIPSLPQFHSLTPSLPPGDAASSSALPQVPSSPSSFAPGHFAEGTPLIDSSRLLSVSSPASSINGTALALAHSIKCKLADSSPLLS